MHVKPESLESSHCTHRGDSLTHKLDTFPAHFLGKKDMSTSAENVDEMSRPLEDRILHRYAHSKFPSGWSQEYVPRNCLDEIITKSSIIQEFHRGSDLDGENKRVVDVDEDLIDFILHSAKKVFAISLISGVVTSELQQTMKVFKASGFGDDKLPISFMDSKRPPWLHLKHQLSNVRKHNFMGHQWKFLVPVFRDGQINVEIGSRTILPFKLVSDQKREGTFSDVWEVTVHKAHLENPMRKVSTSSLNLPN